MTEVERSRAHVVALVGGVGELYQGDLDVARHVLERLAVAELGSGVLVEDLGYGAVAVCQRLDEVAPDRLVLVGAEARGRLPGTVSRWLVEPGALDPAVARGAVADAVTGYVSVGLLVDVAAALEALPRRTVVVAIEPDVTGPSTTLSGTVMAAVPAAVTLVQAEVRRAPVLALAAQLRSASAAGQVVASPARSALEALLVELDRLDADGRWGRTFAERDRLRTAIAAGDTGPGMTHLDWGLWWALIEALDRLQALDALPGDAAR